MQDEDGGMQELYAKCKGMYPLPRHHFGFKKIGFHHYGWCLGSLVLGNGGGVITEGPKIDYGFLKDITNIAWFYYGSCESLLRDITGAYYA